MAEKNFEIGRRPDYILSALCKRTELRGRVGAAWVNEDGTLSIKLNAFVVLSANDDLVITLFENDDKNAPWKRGKGSPEGDTP